MKKDDVYVGQRNIRIENWIEKKKINFTETFLFFIIFSEPPLLGPGGVYPAYGPPEYHQTGDGWKGAPGHPGLIKEPPITPRNGPTNFVGQGGQPQGAVMMVYGLDSMTSNTDKLFNLVCLYGNVARVC